MEWLQALRKTVDYVETHLLEKIEVDEIAEQFYISSFYFQKGFKLITGYTLGEYIRNRRLYLAALEVATGEDRIIDLAYKYGYDSPESFTKAFTRFHGISPIRIKKEPHKMNIFQPLQITISIKGGEKLDFRVEEMQGFEVVGIEKIFKSETAFDQIPLFWEEWRKGIKKCEEIDEAIYGICIDRSMKGETLEYLIATQYHGIEKHLNEKSIPPLTWAKFRCIGPMPQALQTLYTKIFNEWLPTNPDYDIAAGYNIEKYLSGDIYAVDYESEIWIPIKKKDD